MRKAQASNAIWRWEDIEAVLIHRGFLPEGENGFRNWSRWYIYNIVNRSMDDDGRPLPNRKRRKQGNPEVDRKRYFETYLNIYESIGRVVPQAIDLVKKAAAKKQATTPRLNLPPIPKKFK